MKIVAKWCCYFFITSSATSTTGCLSFLNAIMGMTTDDISFKILIDAWSPGLAKSLFVSTASPIFLALTLVPLFIAVQKVMMVLEKDTGDRRRGEGKEEGVGVGSVELGPYYHSLPLQNEDTSFVRDDNDGEEEASNSPNIFFPKPHCIHLPLALLDHSVTLLATIAGPNTPGHIQVLINQTMLPLTALFSYLVFQKRYSVLQVISSIVIVLGTILAGIGTLESSNEKDTGDDTENEEKDSYEQETLLVLGRNISVFLFFMAQIPNATSAVWKEYILKKKNMTIRTITTSSADMLSSSSSMPNMMEMTNYKIKNSPADMNSKTEANECHPEQQQQQQQQQQRQNSKDLLVATNNKSQPQQEENLSMSLRIIHLATCISILRSIIALFSFLLLSFFILSNNNNNPIKQSWVQFITNENNGTTLLLVNDFTYVYSKLAHLRITSEKGGAFLSVLAGTIAMPLQVLLFRLLLGKEKEGLSTMTCWGLGFTLAGMLFYVWAVPEEFGNRLFGYGGGRERDDGVRER